MIPYLHSFLFFFFFLGDKDVPTAYYIGNIGTYLTSMIQ